MYSRLVAVRHSSDRRVNRSRSALEHAFLELIDDHDLTQISIIDVTRRADINRSTFYEHYASVDELAVTACETLFDQLIDATPVTVGRAGRADEEHALEGLSALFSHIAEHARLYRALVGDGGSARVVNHMHQRLTVATHVNLRHAKAPAVTHTADPLEIPHDVEAALFAGALLGAILDWLHRGCPGTAQEMSMAVWPLIRGAGTPAD